MQTELISNQELVLQTKKQDFLKDLWTIKCSIPELYFGIYKNKDEAFDYLCKNTSEFATKLNLTQYVVEVMKEKFCCKIRYMANWSSVFYTEVVFQIMEIQIDQKQFENVFNLINQDYQKTFCLEIQSLLEKITSLESKLSKQNSESEPKPKWNSEREKLKSIESLIQDRNDYLTTEMKVDPIEDEEKATIIRNFAQVQQEVLSLIQKKFQVAQPVKSN